MFLLQFLFFFDDGLSFENNLYIIEYVMIVIMIINKISLKENVENNNNQFYYVNDLIEAYYVNDLIKIIFIFVFRNCYYFLIKLI